MTAYDMIVMQINRVMLQMRQDWFDATIQERALHDILVNKAKAHGVWK